MRRGAAVILACILVGAFCVMAIAQDENDDNMMMGRHKMMGKGMMMGKCERCGMMMHSMMMGKSMSVLPDGTIIVMMGNRLLKYDKDLMLLKEIEINTEGMKNSMMKMMEECPDCKKMMETGTMPESKMKMEKK